MECQNCIHFKGYSEKRIQDQKDKVAKLQKYYNHPNWFIRFIRGDGRQYTWSELNWAERILGYYMNEGFCFLKPKWEEVDKKHFCSSYQERTKDAN